MTNNSFYLIHSAKGSTWTKKDHKYLYKKDGKYVYPGDKDLKSTNNHSYQISNKPHHQYVTPSNTVAYDPYKPGHGANHIKDELKTHDDMIEAFGNAMSNNHNNAINAYENRRNALAHRGKKAIDKLFKRRKTNAK